MESSTVGRFMEAPYFASLLFLGLLNLLFSIYLNVRVSLMKQEFAEMKKELKMHEVQIKNFLVKMDEIDEINESLKAIRDQMRNDKIAETVGSKNNWDNTKAAFAGPFKRKAVENE